MRPTIYALFTAFILSSTLLCPARAFAHAHHDEEDSQAHERATAELMLKIAELTPAVLADEGASQVNLILGQQQIAMNGAFWQLVRGWIRLYYQELQHDCDECVQISEHQFLAVADDQIAKSFLQMKVYRPFMNSLGHIAVGTAGLGARLGKVALVAKATSEVAETVLSKTIGAGGVHVVCNLLDAVILFGSRHIQTASRVFSWTSSFGGSRLANVAQLGFVAASVHRVQKRARFLAGPVQVNEEVLQELNANAPTRWWGLVKDPDRTPWVRELAAEGVKDLQRTAILGSIPRRILWLKPKPKSPFERVLNSNWLWLLQVQESLLQKSLIRTATADFKNKNLAQLFASDHDEIRQGLAREFSPQQAQFVEELLKDVEVVFNPQASKSARYLQVSVLENLLGGFLYSIYNQILEEKGELHGSSWSGVWHQARLTWHGGKFVSYIYEWADFLRLASLQTDPEKIARFKYEAMESLLRILTHIQSASEVVKIKTIEDLFRFEGTLKDGNRKLQSFRPWVEKRATHSWKPWGRDAVCKELHEVLR
jgi:hypothetical protein